MVSLPTPPGPETTTISARWAAESAVVELFEQRLSLVLPETLDAAGLADAEGNHETTGLDLPQTGERLEHGDDLSVSHYFVPATLLQQLRERDRSHLEFLLQLGALATGGRRLVERSLTLVR